MLEGQLVTLRAPRESDLPAITAMRNDMALQAMVMGTPHPNTSAMASAWMTRRLEDPRSAFFIVADRASAQPLGYVLADGLDPWHRHGELGICLAAAARGRGQGSEALALLERYLIDVFGLRKVVVRVLASNAAALRLFAKAGYREVGVLRAHFCWAGDCHDVVLLEKPLA